MIRSRIVPLACGLLLCLCLTPAGRAAPAQEADRVVDHYNRLLSTYCRGSGASTPSLAGWQIKNLVNLICQLLETRIEDPSVLQRFEFVESYQTLVRLEKDTQALNRDLVASWKGFLVQLDVRACRINNFEERPSARWVAAWGKVLPAAPSPRMLQGYVEREKSTVFIPGEGRPGEGVPSGPDKLRYVLVQCLVPGILDPEVACTRLHAFPPEKSNPRLLSYWEVLLEPRNQLIRRHYGIRPFPGYQGTMENYYRIAYRDEERLVILEQNARQGKFVLQTDNAGVFIRCPPHGVKVAMLFSGKYLMEEFFYILAGGKLLREPTEVMAILRQFMLAPEKGADAAVEAGRRDFRDNQWRARGAEADP